MVDGRHVPFRGGLHVEAGGEGAAFAADQHGADRIVLGESLQRGAALVHRLIVEGVEDLRAIEDEGLDGTIRLDLDMGVGYERFSTFPQSDAANATAG